MTGTIGILGLGQIGGTAAKLLLKAGHAVAAVDRPSAAWLAEAGGTLVPDAASLARECDIPEDVFFLELCLEPLLSEACIPVYRERSPFPGVRRDLSILMDQATTCSGLIEEIRQSSPLVTDVTVFDLYQGEHVPEGKRSLAMSVLFQSGERTLRDKEVDKVFNRIFRKLVEKFGIQLVKTDR